MTQEEIKEGNRIIAEFMGAVINPNWTDEATYCFQKYNVPTKTSGFNWAVSQMQYHSSYDWIMPVVEKIEAIEDNDGFTPFVVEIICNDTAIKDQINRDIICYEECETKIESIFKAVVEFIKKKAMKKYAGKRLIPEYNEILFHARNLTDEQFKEYWNDINPQHNDQTADSK